MIHFFITRQIFERTGISFDNNPGPQLALRDIPVLSVDADNFYTIDILSLWQRQNAVFSFHDTSPAPIYSYVQTVSDAHNAKITHIVEKEKISDFANCGAYGFESHKQLADMCRFIIERNIRQKNEFYTSTVIAEMLKNVSADDAAADEEQPGEPLARRTPPSPASSGGRFFPPSPKNADAPRKTTTSPYSA